MVALRLVAWLLLAGLWLPLVAAPAPEPIDAARFLDRPRHASVTLSPDGRRVALSLRRGERNVIACWDSATRQISVVAEDERWDLIQPVWVSPTRLVYKTWDYRATLAGNRAGAMHAVDVDGGRPRRLWDSVEESSAAGRSGWSPMTVLGPGDAQAQELLVTLTDRAAPGSPERFAGSDVYAVDTLSGRRRLLTLDNPGQVQAWFVDADHRVRAALAMRVDREAGKARYLAWYRGRDDAPWQLLGEHAMDEPGFHPAGIDGDGDLYVVGRRGEDTAGLYRWDFEAGAPGALLLRHPRADIAADDLLWDERRRLLGVDVPAMQRERHHVDARAAKLQQAVDQALPGRRNRITQRGDHALVISTADVDPGTLYLLDVKTRRLELLFRYLPELPPQALSPKHVVGWHARDGLEIPAYLTLPRGRQPRGLPLVVLVHGGPAERDSWGDYWEENEPLVQLLASRGWAVLQPQYRGSYGLGWRLFRAGWKQWADGSVDDVADGVADLVAQGVVDAARVCTMGKSAGGYTAMMSLIRHPKRYRCGVSWAGTTEMALFFGGVETRYSGSAWLNAMAPWTHVAPHEHDYMARASVARNGHRIEVPVLLAYGSADRVVPLVHGERLRESLLRANRPHEWIVYPDEGHGWALQTNRVDFARAVERFLARHLTAGEGAPPP